MNINFTMTSDGFMVAEPDERRDSFTGAREDQRAQQHAQELAREQALNGGVLPPWSDATPDQWREYGRECRRRCDSSWLAFARRSQRNTLPPGARIFTRVRGAGRPRAQATRSSKRSGDGPGDDSGGSEPPGSTRPAVGGRA